MQTILGAGSPVSRELAKELSNYTSKIRLVSRNSVKVNPTDEIMHGDLTDRNFLENAVKDSEVVYLTIGLNYKTAVWKTQWPKLMRDVTSVCANHGAKIVFLDNMYMYDARYLSDMTEETPINPMTEKGKIRADVYNILLEAVDKEKIQAVTGRAADFYGPGVQTSMLAQSVYNRLKENKNPQWIGNPDAVHSFTFSRDIGKGLAMLGNTPDCFNQVWHLPTTEKKLTATEWIELFMQEMNIHKKIQTVNYTGMTLLGLFIPVLKELKDVYYQLEKDYFFNSGKFNKRFNYTPILPQNGVKETTNA